MIVGMDNDVRGRLSQEMALALGRMPIVPTAASMNPGQRLVIAQVNNTLNAMAHEVKEFGLGSEGGLWPLPLGLFVFRGTVIQYPAASSPHDRLRWLLDHATPLPRGAHARADDGRDLVSEADPESVRRDLREPIPGGHEVRESDRYIVNAGRVYRDWHNRVTNLLLLGSQIGGLVDVQEPYARLSPQQWLAMSGAERLIRAGGSQTVKNVVDGYMHDASAQRIVAPVKAPAVRGIRPAGQVDAASDVTPPSTLAATGMSKTTVGVLSLLGGVALGAGAMHLVMKSRASRYEQSYSEQRG